MGKFSQIAAAAKTVLLLVCLMLAPILVYVLGIPWLPSLPQASTSQLALVYAISSPLISVVGGLLVNNLLRGQESNSRKTMPKPQSQQITHDNPIVIGRGRGENYWLCVLLIFVGVILMAGIIYLTSSTDTNDKLMLVIMLVMALLIIIGIVSLSYGTRR